jgi:hypothetical protein
MEYNGCLTTLVPWISAFKPEAQFFHLFTFRRLAKYSETLPNLILVLMDYNGCFATSVPRNSAFGPETQILLIFSYKRLAKCSKNTPKHYFGSNGVEWMIRNLSTLKLCIQAWNTSSASFYVLKVSETVKNTPKHLFGSNGVEWMLHNFSTLK